MGQAIKIGVHDEQLVTPRWNGSSDGRIEELHRLAFGLQFGNQGGKLRGVRFSEVGNQRAKTIHVKLRGSVPQVSPDGWVCADQEFGGG